MAGSLETRVPMRGHPLLESLFRLPADFHLKDGHSKALLRAAMAGSLPGSTMRRKKQGFTAPLNRWFCPRNADWARRLVRDGAAVELGLLRPDAIDRVRMTPE